MSQTFSWSGQDTSITKGPLSGLKVLEIGSMLAGPFVGTMLGDFGANIIKVEKPGHPDHIREWPPHKRNVSLWWKSIARNKFPITLDISKEAGQTIALELMSKCDIVVENFRPGTIEKWGLDPSRLRDKYPRLVWVRVSGWGQTGPYRDRAGYATVAEAFSGLASFTGYADRGPMISSFPLGDFLAGVFGAFGALAAIVERDRSGNGQVVDVSLFEPFLRIIESAVLRYDLKGELKPRMGNQMEEDVPRNIYETSDAKHFSVSVGPQQAFEGFADAMNKPELKSDPRFTSLSNRVINRDTIDSIITAWAKGVTLEQAIAVLRHNGVVVGPVNSLQEVFTDPHVIARRIIETISDSDFQKMRVVQPVPRLSHTPGTVRWTGKESGAANDFIYKGLLHFNEQKLQELKRHNVI